MRNILPYQRNLANYAIAMSALALADSLSSLQRKKNSDSETNPEKNKQQIPTRKAKEQQYMKTPMVTQLKSRVSLLQQIPQVKCEAFQETLTQQNKVASLSRRATIRLLEETSHPIQNMRALYKIYWKKPLGEGAFGTVYLATNRKNADQVAVKKIPKRLTDDASFQNEVNALVRVRENGGHPYICGLREIFEDEKYYYMVLDLVSGGEMFEHLIKLGAYSEADASRLVKEVAAALTFLHGIGIVHGDLKPENLMLSTDRTEDGTIQIVDFGCAQVSDESGGVEVALKSSAGNTPAYCPPEVLESSNRTIAPPMDVWGLGVILYIMLVGLHPFDLNGKCLYKMVENIC
jgi:Serine/threonine protein kinase